MIELDNIDYFGGVLSLLTKMQLHLMANLKPPTIHCIIFSLNDMDLEYQSPLPVFS